MRIIAGAYRGTALASVGKGDNAAHLRPTSDRVRESLFNVLLGGRFGDPITGSKVLDLFAGTGALGLEALSRGAASVTFVDDGRKAQSLIRENIAKLRAGDQSRLLTKDATRLPENPGAPFEMIFLDPPYGKGMGQKALVAALDMGWVADDALIVWEEDAEMQPPEGFRLLERRAHGGTCITFLTKQEVDQ